MQRFCVFFTSAVLCVSFVAYGQTSFYEQVTSLWYSGQKTNVLNIAEQRLQQNTNDIAGLILKALRRNAEKLPENQASGSEPDA